MMLAAAKSVSRTPEQRENNAGGVTGKGFVKGRSGNPKGRPKGSGTIGRELRRIVSENDGAVAARIAEALIQRALGGSLAAIRLIIDRVDGPISKWRPEPCACGDDYDFSQLSDREQSQLVRLLDKARR